MILTYDKYPSCKSGISVVPAAAKLLESLIPDGHHEVAPLLPAIIANIAQTARWVDPETFRRMPLWYPWMARGQAVFKADWTTRSENTRRATSIASPRTEANIVAAQALMNALGVTGRKPPNWTVCHIWGYDDTKFRGSSVVSDPRFYSCVGNMVWLPTPLKGFTDSMPVIKHMLRACAYHLYGWTCEHPSVTNEAGRIRAGELPNGYPNTWPSPERPGILPPGTCRFTSRIGKVIEREQGKLQAMMDNRALENFPRDQVIEVLKHWKMSLQEIKQ